MNYKKTIGVIAGLFVFISSINISFVHSVTADPVTVYVSPDGSADFTSIQAAVNAANDSDTVFVYSGHYRECVVINKSINLIGENKTSTFIYGDEQHDLVRIMSPDVTISGFTLRNYYSQSPPDPDDPDMPVFSFDDGSDDDEEPSFVSILVRSDSNTIAGNIIVNNAYGDGILVYNASGNCFHNNFIKNNKDDGIEFLVSSGNIVTNNTFVRNGLFGVITRSTSEDNVIFHNNFIDNQANAGDYNGANRWNSMYPNGGNYWSDYSGIDSDGDGIGDSAYNISGGDNHDQYPFMHQDGWIPPENQPPVADFTVEPQYPFINEEVEFNASGSYDPDGEILEYEWNFGDGSPSVQGQIVTHRYRYNDSFCVRLIVSDGELTDEIDHEVTVGNHPPVVNYTINHPLFTMYHSPTVLDELEFVSTSFDPDEQYGDYLALIEWGVNEQIECNDEVFRYQFTTADSYTVDLEVFDSHGASDSHHKRITVKAAVGHNFDADPHLEQAADNNNDIKNAVSNGYEQYRDVSGTYAKFSQDINGDGKIDHIIADEGMSAPNIYWDPFNNIITDIVIIESMPLLFAIDSSGDGVYDTILDNDGHLSHDTSPPTQVQNLQVSDNHDLTLTLSWDAAADYETMVDAYQIYRDDNPLIRIPGSSLSFTDDGTIPGFPIEYHATYYYNVSAVDLAGNEGKKSEGVIIMATPDEDPDDGKNNNIPPGYQNQGPVADASANAPYDAVIGEEIVFNGSLSYDPDGKIVAYRWDFDDGTQGNGVIVPHVYLKAGTYNVELTVCDNASATDTDSVYVTISKPNNPPSEPAVNGPTNGSRNISYCFRAVSIDADNDTLQYVFNWGDGTENTTDFIANGTLAVMNHSWAKPGKYSISVTAYDNNTYSRTTKTILLIDAHEIRDVIKGYLLDENGDRIYDVFHNEVTAKETGVNHKKNGEYLIDVNEDAKWDFVYHMQTRVLEQYIDPVEPEEETPMFLLVGLVIGILLCLVIILILVLGRKGIREK